MRCLGDLRIDFVNDARLRDPGAFVDSMFVLLCCDVLMVRVGPCFDDIWQLFVSSDENSLLMSSESVTFADREDFVS